MKSILALIAIFMTIFSIYVRADELDFCSAIVEENHLPGTGEKMEKKPTKYNLQIDSVDSNGNVSGHFDVPEKFKIKATAVWLKKPNYGTLAMEMVESKSVVVADITKYHHLTFSIPGSSKDGSRTTIFVCTKK